MSARWQVLLKSKWTKWAVGAGVLVKVGLVVAVMSINITPFTS